MVDVMQISKKGDPIEKANYRPFSFLPSLSKVYEKVVYQQLNAFFKNKLSPLLYGFCSSYSTQLRLLNLNKKWHSFLGSSRVVGTIHMDLSKAFICLPNERIMAKLHAYGVDIKRLNKTISPIKRKDSNLILPSVHG